MILSGNQMKIKVSPRTMSVRKTLTLFVLALSFAGCSTLAKKNDTGVVVARRAQIRSYTAVVAANLVEVARGDQVDMLDTSTASDTGEKWLRVRARKEESTEGWLRSEEHTSELQSLA